MIEITYTEKETYKKKVVTLNAKELALFYQEKPYEQIIKVKEVN